MQIVYIVDAIVMGLGATLFIDLWALFLKRAFAVPSLDVCLLGRWLLYMPRGTVVHQNIGVTPAKAHECQVGWTAHYLIGMTFALLFLLMVSPEWFRHPTLLPALLFGIVTVVLPFFTMQPSFGLGIAASKTRRPNAARLKSLVTHSVFGVGLYVWALLLRLALFASIS